MRTYVQIGTNKRPERGVWIMVLLVPLLTVFWGMGQRAQAAGTERQIASCADLDAVNDHLDDNYTLTVDLDCYDVARIPIGSHDEPFTGEFNGGGHSILTYVGTGVYDYAGLFGSISGANVHDLNLSGLVIADGDNVGGLAGEATGNSRVTHVTSSMEIQATGSRVGGLIGALVTNVTGSFMYNSASGNVSGDGNVGGLYGYATLSNISRSFATGDVSATGDNAGGFMGYSGGYGATEVYATGNVHTDTMRAGGLIGLQENGYIADSYARGNASATSPGYYVGGLIGAVNATHLSRVYSTGTASGNLAVGGLVGYSVDETYIYDSFTTGLVEGDDPTVSSLVGQDFSDYLVTANAYANADNERYCMVGISNEDRGGCTQVSFVADPARYFAATDEPLKIGDEQIWDVDAVWQTHDDDFPTLRSASLVMTGGEASKDLTSAQDSSALRLAVAGCHVIDAMPSTESSNAVQDPAYSYPVGFVSFTLQGCAEGGVGHITLTVAGSFDPAAVIVRKYNADIQSYTTLTSANSNVELSTTTLGGHAALQVSYNVTDGGELDQDGTANGEIVDPVGLGVQVVTAPNTGL